MFIKSIMLEGFKSYGSRVEITGFDPAFNAITGLNGTGKSNILDSICFVLGITNLSNVRAGSLTELIYKHGQAGVSKATVSIVFDNSDKSQAPVGYEATDEIIITRMIVIGGKNKYMINGINVNNRRVYDLFCSIQLNVNNPHFLIMQGRITKVLNMKPPEILSMIEEAAGTSMYETKKLQAQNTIARKDAKLAELDDIIREDIAPKLQKLQDERTQFQEHQQVVREIDGITKLHKAYQYHLCGQRGAELEGQVRAAQADAQAAAALASRSEGECEAIDAEIAEIHKKLDEESAGALQALQSELAAAERAEEAAAAALRAAEQAAAELRARRERDRAALQADRAALEAKRAAAERAAADSADLRAAGEASAAALDAAQRRYLAVSEGREGGADSLQDQLMAARRAAAEADTRARAGRMQLRAHAERLARLRRALAAAGPEHERAARDVARREDELRALRAALPAPAEHAARAQRLQAEARALQAEARAHRDRMDELAARLQRCDFAYDPPQPDFDGTKVHGTIARLIEVCDPIYCTALETVAGGRLYNVVVDSERTSKLLLQRGNLRTRTTIIPLNKISGQLIDQQTVAAAQEIGGGAESVQLALSLVRFAAELAPAMRWVFGGTLVCRDLDTARRVCFHPRVRRRVVTLDGDVFDPAGTLAGGARAREPSALLRLAELAAAERALPAAEAGLAAARAALADLAREAERRRAADVAEHELGVLRARLAETDSARTLAEVRSLEEQVSEVTAALERDESARREAAARAAELEAKVDDIQGHREREFEKAEEALEEAKRAASAHGAAWRARSLELDALRLEADELAACVAGAAALEPGAAAAAAAADAELARAGAGHARAADAVRELQARRARLRQDAAARSREVAQRAARKEALRGAARDAELRRQRREQDAAALRREAEEQRARIARLTAENPWIAAEKEYFGAAGGAYDFAAKRAAAAGARLEALGARRAQLARGLNARAHTLHCKEEEQYAELLRKKRIVEADRRKLVDTMRELDEKKRATLLQACERVNRDFGAIFGALLPGAQAQLAPPPGRSVLDGLEVRVGFNATWKESLGELSGGQRSLVALALVLAMLRFKPAPLYILDEVDAALDLSHTQNIGVMLREHFRHSQFIIVSLKDGMFNNANVLFRTRFQDGMSSVTRTVTCARH